MARIALAGFLHESNTFVKRLTDLDAFLTADAWPGLVQGQALLEEVAGVNLAISGFILESSKQGHDLLPLLWASANPSGPVTEAAYEKICALIIEKLQGVMPIDALFLDLHGAMVVEHIEDGEGELLARLRAILGPAVPIVASLDFHANISPRMVHLSEALTVYRSYPHVDMSDTGRRAALLLQRILAGEKLYKAYRQIPFLIPMLWQCTLIAPFNALMKLAEEQEKIACVSASIAPGFPLADIFDCGPAVIAYGTDPVFAEAAAQRLYDALMAHRDEFCGQLFSSAEAVSYALDRHGSKSVILVDTQDNPGGGAAGDSTDILHELVRQKTPNACVGILLDPVAAEKAHAAGVGATISLALGGQSGIGAEPLFASYLVEALGNGQFSATGDFYQGCKMDLGLMARLRLGGVQILVSSKKQQAADQAMFRHLGIEPAQQAILVLKSSVHFRADFTELASEIIIVAASGENYADLTKLIYKHLRPDVSVE
jgi:microcystin degradation protein MlrC